MNVTIFRFRIAEGAAREFFTAVQRMNELAAAMPGYIAHKAFRAEDGEFLIHIEFESEETMRAWGRHPEHLQAKTDGRQKFFSEYRTQVCNLIRESKSKPLAS